MDRIPSFFRMTMLALSAVGLLAGCQTDRLKAERDALYNHNQQLQVSVTDANAQRDAAAAERARLEAELAETNGLLLAERSRPAPAPQIITVPAASANTPVNSRTGFEGISGIETEKNRDRIIVRVPGDVLFESGKIDLRQSSLKTLDSVAAVIRKEYSGNVIRIEGYTDSDPIRKSQWKDNLELSMERAASVHRHLQSKGLNPKQMYAAGFGPANARATKAQSRRVEIVVVLNEKLVSSKK